MADELLWLGIAGLGYYLYTDKKKRDAVTSKPIAPPRVPGENAPPTAAQGAQVKAQAAEAAKQDVSDPPVGDESPGIVVPGINAGPVLLTQDPIPVSTGQRYRVEFILDPLSAMVDNQTAAAILANNGFTSILVTGTGVTRVAEATYSGSDGTLPRLPQISKVFRLPPADNNPNASTQ